MSAVWGSIAIAVLMVVTGSLNTLAAKWADSLVSQGIRFDHPFFQAVCMFIGEFICIIVFFIHFFLRKRIWRNHNLEGDEGAIFDIDYDQHEPTLPAINPFLFAAPALCDVLATSIMYVGLNLTSASSFQMLRGSVIIFTGLLSVAFLHTRLQGFKWLGMGFVTLGLVIVGVSDIVFDNSPNDDINGIITGNLLIIMAQIICAIQMVVEQQLLLKYDVPPLYAVGCEGFFGLVFLGGLLVPFYYIHVSHTFSSNPYGRLEDVFFAIKQIHSNPWIAVALCLTMVSIAFFNFAGVTVTKTLSATTRMVLDSVRTLVIWMVSIPVFGEQFIPFQILGFAFLILGMFVYNDILIGPAVREKVLPSLQNERVSLCCVSFWAPDDGNFAGDEQPLVGVDDGEDDA